MASLRPTISTVSTVISSDDVIRQLVGSAKPNVVEQVLNSSEIKSLMATLLKLEKSSATSSATKNRSRPVYPKKSKRKKKTLASNNHLLMKNVAMVAMVAMVVLVAMVLVQMVVVVTLPLPSPLPSLLTTRSCRQPPSCLLHWRD